MQVINVIFFLSSGLFLGWSLGANDAANVFGTAVSSRMIKFGTAAVICAIFLTIGSVMSGSGAAHTLGKLGAVDTLPGAFTVALASALTVFLMTKMKLPVSTSQAIVGAIIGWNFFSGNPTDVKVVSKIVSTWVLCPLLSMFFAVIVFKIFKYLVEKSNIHIVRQDTYTRAGLIVAGAFGSYALGANNIANVMGVFVPSSPFKDITLYSGFVFTSVQQLFLLGAVAISIGVYTYSKRVMVTLGSDLFKLSPVASLVVVISSSLVLFVFSSHELNLFLASIHLPQIPLVPVSSSQAVVGAVVGIGLIKGGKEINLKVLAKISSGWIATPLFSAVVSYITLFFMQNVFMNQVFQ
ncbi:MAG: inorganic phosphate transporter [Halobacteriovoraceae bacterium]|nr:inorganic phosphate transporter [Halobacteriovoraceae bacterium]